MANINKDMTADSVAVLMMAMGTTMVIDGNIYGFGLIILGIISSRIKYFIRKNGS